MLGVQDLRVTFQSDGKALSAVDGVSLTLDRGESLGIVGESGCGKTTLTKAILRLLPANAKTEGRVEFQGKNLVELSVAGLREIRWQELSLITQSAMNALDPVWRVGDQLIEAIRLHDDCSKAEARARSVKLFDLVGLKSEWLDRYPHEYSGGMKQRAIIAMALALGPAMIVADEPTTALDVVMQDQVFAEIDRIRAAGKTGIVLITHDISLVAENCDRVAVMYAGKIVEYGNTKDILDLPKHPYTIGLRNAFAELDGDHELISISGGPPDLTNPPKGCRFKPRCPLASDGCNREPPLSVLDDGRSVACHNLPQVEAFRGVAKLASTWEMVERS
ncbi:oligopeptide/dipeptide ABC transporter ATP-binding protein [Aquamicrobium terrae]|uniref:Oligopeptide/dipeptide ABC transporter ATP-binding protein n=2 Tax=Aquamicrobium terrae TaxID=1324945 RepID=A0ABV2N6V2_9HYPH